MIKPSAPKNSLLVSPVTPAMATMTIFGGLLVLFSVVALLACERGKKSYKIQQARTVDPARPQIRSGMVKFTAIPDAGWVHDPVSGQDFVAYSSSRYVYRRVKRPNSKKTVYQNEWKYEGRFAQKASFLRFGQLTVRLNEAQLAGETVWKKTITRRGANDVSLDPKPGDEKFYISGIPKNGLVFVVGDFRANTIGGGDVFVVSGFSEEKTIDKVSGGAVGRFFARVFLFPGLALGLVLLVPIWTHYLRLHSFLPVFGFFAKVKAWAWGLLCVIGAFLITFFSGLLSILLWVVPLTLIGLFAFWAYFKQRKKGSAIANP